MDEKETAGLQPQSTAAAENATGAQGGADASAEEAKAENANPGEPQSFTQEQVNQIVRERLDRDRKGIYGKLGVSDDAGLEEIIKKVGDYDGFKSKYDALASDNESLKEKIMFYENGVLPSREDDVRVYFKGKGVAMTSDSLKTALETHPEWLKGAEAPSDGGKKTTVMPIGSAKSEEPKESEQEAAAKLFGLSKFVD